MTPIDTNLLTTLATGSPAALMLVAIVILWKQIGNKDSESIKRGETRDARIAHLENKQDEHAEQYRVLAERIAEVVGQTKDVMEKVLSRLH